MAARPALRNYLSYEEVAEYAGLDEATVRASAHAVGVAGRRGIWPSALDAVIAHARGPEASPEDTAPVLPAPSPEEVTATRERLGLTKKDLALRLGVNPKLILRWEEGERAIPANLRATFAALTPPPPKRTRPAVGDTVTLHQLGTLDWLAVSGDLATPIGAYRLAADLTPPHRLVLDKQIVWEPAPADLPAPAATYTVEERRHVLILTCPDIPAPEPVPDDGPFDMYQFVMNPPRRKETPVLAETVPVPLADEAPVQRADARVSDVPMRATLYATRGRELMLSAAARAHLGHPASVAITAAADGGLLIAAGGPILLKRDPGKSASYYARVDAWVEDGTLRRPKGSTVAYDLTPAAGGLRLDPSVCTLSGPKNAPPPAPGTAPPARSSGAHPSAAGDRAAGQCAGAGRPRWDVDEDELPIEDDRTLAKPAVLRLALGVAYRELARQDVSREALAERAAVQAAWDRLAALYARYQAACTAVATWYAEEESD